MDEILVVRGRKPAGHLGRQVDRLAQRHGAVRQSLAQRLAFQQLHDHVGRGGMRAEFEDGDDVGMRERGDGLRLALEPSESIRIAGDGRRHDFDGDLAPEFGIASAVDLAHAAGADGAQHIVGAEPSAGSEGHDGRDYVIGACRISGPN